jgi:ferredoxin, 2Fe-2S
MTTIEIHLIHPDGTRRTLQSRQGQSLMQAAVDANVDGIDADCGGSLTCATCHVFVEPEWTSRLPAVSNDEQGLLDFTATPREAGSRLSCQITLTPELAGLTVRLPSAQH